MADFNILEKVKIGLGLQGNDYFDDTLNFYIGEVKEYLISAGCSKSIVDSSKAIGTICRGVADLWNYGAGNSALSPYFKERAIQLSYETGGDLNV